MPNYYDSTPPPANMGNIPTSAPYHPGSFGGGYGYSINPQNVEAAIPTTYEYVPQVGFVPSNWRENAQGSGSGWQNSAQGQSWQDSAQGQSWQNNAQSHATGLQATIDRYLGRGPDLSGPNAIGGIYGYGSGGSGASAGMGGGFGAAGASGNFGYAPGGGGQISHFIQALLHSY